MQEVDINTLVNKNGVLNKNIPNNTIIVGKIESLYINYKYDQLDLSKVECNEIIYFNQKGNLIKNHILPNLLKELYCWNNELTSLPDFSLKELNCDSNSNKLTSLPVLPKSLTYLYCNDNELTSLPVLPNSLFKLSCSHNKLIFLSDLPNSLYTLSCSNNK